MTAFSLKNGAPLRDLLLCVLMLAPLAFGAVEPWAWGPLGLTAVLLLLAWAWERVRQGALRLVWSPVYLPAALLFILVAVQYSGRFTLDPIGSRESLLKLAAYYIIFFLAGQLWNPPSSIPSEGPSSSAALGLPVTVYSFSMALFAILQFFSSHGLIYWVVRPRWGGWVFGPYVNHNHYAGLMEMLIPVSAAYVFSKIRVHRRARVSPVATPLPAREPNTLVIRHSSHWVLFCFLVAVPIASLLLSGSRGGLVALAAETGLMLPVLFVGSAYRPKPVLGAALGLIGAAVMFCWLDPGGLSHRLASVARVGQASEATFGERKVVALDSLKMFRAHYLEGVGAGSFETAYPLYRSFPSDLDWGHAHNDYAEALAETGLPGGLLILAVLALFLPAAYHNFRTIQRYHVARTGRLSVEGAWMRLGAAVGCCGLLVHSLFDFNLHIPANAAWFAFLAGIAVVHTRSSSQLAEASRPQA